MGARIRVGASARLWFCDSERTRRGGLWLLARLGRVAVAKPFLIAVGAKLWHFGVLVGLVAIITGQTSGYEWFELPRYAAVILSRRSC